MGVGAQNKMIWGGTKVLPKKFLWEDDLQKQRKLRWFFCPNQVISKKKIFIKIKWFFCPNEDVLQKKKEKKKGLN